MAIAAITAAELLVGVELSHGKAKQRRAGFVEDVLSSLPVEPYDLEVARTHAELLAHTRRSYEYLAAELLPELLEKLGQNCVAVCAPLDQVLVARGRRPRGGR